MAPDKFKSYDQLKERLDKVLGRTTAVAKAVTPPAPKAEEVVAAKPVFEKKEEPTPEPVAAAPKAEDDEDVMNYFRRLSEE